MDNFREDKLHPLLKSLEIPQAGFHAFRHFKEMLMDANNAPLRVRKERMGHQTGVFTLDVYGGKPEWNLNLDAARNAGAEIANAVAKLEEESRILAA